MVSTAVTSLLGKGGMVDILFSNECLKAGVPMVCIGRRPGWLQTKTHCAGTPTLFDEFSKQDQVPQELQSMGPWGGVPGASKNSSTLYRANKGRIGGYVTKIQHSTSDLLVF